MEHRPVAPLVEDDHTALVMVALLGTMVVASGALLLNLFDLNLPGRAVLAVISLLTMPGIPLALALPIPRLQVQIVLGIAISLAAALILSTAQLQAGLWSPLLTQVVLFLIGLAATVFVTRASVRR